MRRVLLAIGVLLALPAGAGADSTCGPPPSGDMVALLRGAALATQGGVLRLDSAGRHIKAYALGDDVAGVPALSRVGLSGGASVAAWRTTEGRVRAALLDSNGRAGPAAEIAPPGGGGAVLAGASHVAWAAEDGVHVTAIAVAAGGGALQAGATGVVAPAGARLLGLADGADGGRARIAVSAGSAAHVVTVDGTTPVGTPAVLPGAAGEDAGLRMVGNGGATYAAWVDTTLRVAKIGGTPRSLHVRPLATPWNPAGFAFDGGPGGWLAAWSADGRGGRADIWRASISRSPHRVTRTARYDEFVDGLDASIAARPVVSGTRSVQRSPGELTGNDRPVAAALWSSSGRATILAAPRRGEESAVRVVRANDNAFAVWDHFDLDDQDGDLRVRRVREPIRRFPSPALVAAPSTCGSG